MLKTKGTRLIAGNRKGSYQSRIHTDNMWGSLRDFNNQGFLIRPGFFNLYILLPLSSSFHLLQLILMVNLVSLFVFVMIALLMHFPIRQL